MLLGAPFILPVIVAVLGLLAVFGRNGLMNAALSFLGLPEVSIYGLGGVVLAHVFFNLPLAIRFILQGWMRIPAERFRLAASLNAPVGRLLEWPMLKSVLPGVFAVIFLICLNSFAVALTLGGGPKATTLEVAIYQAVRFDFDLSRASSLALLQLAIGGTTVLVAWRIAVPESFGAGFDRAVTRWDAAGPVSKALDGFFILFAGLFLIVPLAMVLGNGLAGLANLPQSVIGAVFVSLGVAVAATVLCLSAALALALAGGWATSVVGTLPLALSGMVLGIGAFLLLHPFVNPTRLALPMTALINALAALPFALRVLLPAANALAVDYGRLSSALNLSGASYLRWVAIPRLRRPLGFAAGLVAAISVGDLGVIALFANQGHETLPLLMYQLMGAYRMEQAAGVALVLVSLSLSVFWCLDKWGRGNAET